MSLNTDYIKIGRYTKDGASKIFFNILAIFIPVPDRKGINAQDFSFDQYSITGSLPQ